MSVKELTADQLTMVKAQMIVDSLNRNEKAYDFGDIMFPDDVIDDVEAFAYYEGTHFVQGDFV